jgi:hypothetical protein
MEYGYLALSLYELKIDGVNNQGSQHEAHLSRGSVSPFFLLSPKW